MTDKKNLNQENENLNQENERTPVLTTLTSAAPLPINTSENLPPPQITTPINRGYLYGQPYYSSPSGTPVWTHLPHDHEAVGSFPHRPTPLRQCSTPANYENGHSIHANYFPTPLAITKTSIDGINPLYEEENEDFNIDDREELPTQADRKRRSNFLLNALEESSVPLVC